MSSNIPNPFSHHEMSDNVVFSNHGERAILAYKAGCIATDVAAEILNNKAVQSFVDGQYIVRQSHDFSGIAPYIHTVKFDTNGQVNFLTGSIMHGIIRAIEEVGVKTALEKVNMQVTSDSIRPNMLHAACTAKTD